MSLTPQWMDELRMRTTLSTLIGRTVKVQKAGREFKACCPFHNEKSPSFTINDEKGFYHCFGCGAHGDAIRWMTEQRGLPFMEAVKELAQEAGMEVPAPDPRAAKRAEQAKGLHDVVAAAQKFFQEQLYGINGADARAYLHQRGISEATARTFGFGFAPDSRNGLKTALKHFGEPMLIEAGLLIDPDGERDSYDRFRGRLMLPICDVRGRPIAFGGRILGAGEPKYLNSPETPLFDKGRTLYNLDKAAPASRQSNRVIVVEGYMDVIALAQARFTDAVAPLGTAVTEHQIQRLWKLTDVPILCFDGDNAGQKASIRAAIRALPLLQPGMSLAFATLPTGKDPDDIVRSEGPQAMESLLRNAEPLVERLWKHEHGAAALDTPEQRAGLKQRLAEITNQIQHPDIRSLYNRAFKERYDALFYARSDSFGTRRSSPISGSANRWQKDRKGNWKAPLPPAGGEARTINTDGLEGVLLRAVMASLLRYPKAIAQHRELLSSLNIADPQLSAMLDILIQATFSKETVETDGLLTILGQGELYNMAKGLLRADTLTFTPHRTGNAPDRVKRDLDEAIRVMTAGPEIEAGLADATRRMMADMNEENLAEQQRALRLQADHMRRLSELAQPDDIV